MDKVVHAMLLLYACMYNARVSTMDFAERGRVENGAAHEQPLRTQRGTRRPTSISTPPAVKHVCNTPMPHTVDTKTHTCYEVGRGT